jgi:hypothetical protein
MDIDAINATPIRNTKLYSKIEKLFLFRIKEKGIIDIIFFYAMNKKELSFICKHVSLPQEWIHNNRNSLNWNLISSHQHMTIDFIKEHKQYINFDRIFEKNKFIRNYPDYCSLYETYHNMGILQLDFY